LANNKISFETKKTVIQEETVSDNITSNHETSCCQVFARGSSFRNLKVQEPITRWYAVEKRGVYFLE